MGLLTDSIRALAPAQKAQAVAAALSTWEIGVPQMPTSSYEHNAREGYARDELVFDCIDYRADACGEPPICAYRETASGEEKIDDADDHPSLALLNKPNPFMGRSRFWQAISMCLDIGGNAYIEKVRSAAGQVVELWLLRPDRMRVIPDSQRFIGGYRYSLGDRQFMLAPEDVIHLKTRNPLDDFYGLSPIAIIAGRVDIDVWQRQFTGAFFRNAGVPAGLLNVQRAMSAQEKEDQRRRFREIYGGEGGWHKVMLIDGATATYTSMGLPMGQNGLAMLDLNNITETRIFGVFRMPASLIPSIVGQGASSYANRVSDRKLFWEATMTPMFRDIDSALTMGLADEFPDIDRWEHDLSKVKALQEDEDAIHERFRKDWQAGGLTWKEYRTLIGRPEEPDEPGVVLVPTTMVPTPSDQLLNVDDLMLDQPEPATTGPTGEPNPALPPPNGRTNGVAAH